MKKSLKDDVLFKAYFTRYPQFLQEFLRVILNKKITVKKVANDVKLEKLSEKEKYGVLDVEAELENGEKAIVEMQVRDYKNIEERATFYASKRISEQIESGKDYKVIKNIYVIVILNYTLIDVPAYVNKTVRVLDKQRDYEINNIVTYYFIELDKFRKQERDMSIELNQWLSFVDGEKEDWLEVAKAQNAVIRDAITGYEVLTGDAEIKRLKEIEFKSMLEEKSALRVAREEGEARGRAEGKIVGEARGTAKGIKRGKMQVAKKLLAMKMPVKEIAEITGLSVKEIEQLKVADKCHRNGEA